MNRKRSRRDVHVARLCGVVAVFVALSTLAEAPAPGVVVALSSLGPPVGQTWNAYGDGSRPQGVEIVASPRY
jgi:hypothetical protein